MTLRGRHAELVPLSRADRDDLFAASRDPEVRRFLRNGPGETVEDTGRLIETLLAAQAAGTDLPFTIRTVPGLRPVGMTRYLRVDPADDSVEIGGTWIERPAWRTPLNTECKLLLLRHAFEAGQVHRVQLQTDLRNERSQRAIARLGATREGVLRDDVLLPDGYRRSSVYYSVLAPEWPAVRRRLEEALARPWPEPPSSRKARPARGRSPPP